MWSAKDSLKTKMKGSSITFSKKENWYRLIKNMLIIAFENSMSLGSLYNIKMELDGAIT